MAKLAPITVNERIGSATFYHKFPCSVGSDGVFAIDTEDYSEEIKVFAARQPGILSSSVSGRVTAKTLDALKNMLTLFARDMLDGSKEARTLILFNPNARGMVWRGSNGQTAPFNGTTAPYFALHDQTHLGRVGVDVSPEIAVINVTRTTAKGGTVSYTVKKADPSELGPEGEALSRWAPTDIGRDSWWRIEKKLIPYTEETAARLNLIMEDLTRSACYLVDLYREDRVDIWS
jgi:hypothetical protein